MIALLLIACAAATAGAEEPAQRQHRATGELLDVTPNAYGLGVNSDQYGRPHAYHAPDGEALPGVFNDGVSRDAYGLGKHADEFGRSLEDGEP